jgi:acetylglutamate kinase
MLKKNCLVKISGDVISEKALLWIKKLSKNYSVVICVGGSSQINEAFKKIGFKVSKFGPLGRELKKLKEKKLAREVLRKNKTKIQNLLKNFGIKAKVVIPVLDISGVLCHLNGDQFVLSAYLGFDILYVITAEERVNKKRELFASYPKVKVVGFEI